MFIYSYTYYLGMFVGHETIRRILSVEEEGLGKVEIREGNGLHGN